MINKKNISILLANYAIIFKKSGKKSFFVRYINKRTKNGVVKMMRKRVNHRANLKKDSICKGFWKEFAKRGFPIDASNDGVYHKNHGRSQIVKAKNGCLRLKMDAVSFINIVSAKNFIHTVSKIEGIVKYKLFE